VSADGSQKEATPRCVCFSLPVQNLWADIGVDDGLEGELPVGYACQQRTYAFERARSYGVYDEPLGEWLLSVWPEVAKRRGLALAADVAVAVPLHRERQRGYSQAAGPESCVWLVRRMRAWPSPNKQVLSFEERGSPFVALLPHVRAAKLTINASYW
jgi:hypothetical protein